FERDVDRRRRIEAQLERRDLCLVIPVQTFGVRLLLFLDVAHERGRDTCEARSAQLLEPGWRIRGAPLFLGAGDDVPRRGVFRLPLRTALNLLSDFFLLCLLL